jgi:hypothetical protein
MTLSVTERARLPIIGSRYRLPRSRESPVALWGKLQRSKSEIAVPETAPHPDCKARDAHRWDGIDATNAAYEVGYESAFAGNFLLRRIIKVESLSSAKELHYNAAVCDSLVPEIPPMAATNCFGVSLSYLLRVICV